MRRLQQRVREAETLPVLRGHLVCHIEGILDEDAQQGEVSIVPL
jgi:hypothetical protein